MVFILFTLFQDKESVGNLVKLIDKSNGYIFAGIEGSVVEFSKIAAAPVDWDYFRYPFPHFSGVNAGMSQSALNGFYHSNGIMFGQKISNGCQSACISS
ncbi:hypothetical protein C3L33_01309, partial [Rhododendron williamsianum]